MKFKSKRNFLLSWLLIAIIGGTLIFTISEYRAQQIVSKGGELNLNEVGYTPNPGVITSVQNYLNSAQYLAFGLEQIPEGAITKIAPLKSLVGPLPKLSKLNSDKTDGTSIYNLAIYNIKSTNQVFSIVGESWLSLGFIGLIFTFLLQGFIISILQERFVISAQEFSKYLVLYSSVWVSLAPCISYLVLSQISFYVIIPPLLTNMMLRNNLRSDRAFFSENKRRR